MTTIRSRLLLISCGLLLAFAMAACGVSEYEQPGIGVTDDGVVDPNYGVTDAQNLSMPATAILDRDVENDRGEGLGEVEDMIVDLSTGDILFATVEHGGFLDIGDQDLPVPLSALAMNTDNDFLLPIEEEVFENFPEIADDWPSAFTTGWDQEIGTFWNDAGFDQRTLDAEASQFAWVSDLVGYGVNSWDAAAIGNIQNVIVDLGNSQIDYVVMNFVDTGIYGVDWRLVPYAAFDPQTLDAGSLALREDFDTNLLTDAPLIDQTGLTSADMLDPAWDDDIAAYWEDAGFEIDDPSGGEVAVDAPTIDTEAVAEVANGLDGAQERLMQAESILNLDVTAAAGEDFGEIEDLVVDLSNGDVLFVILEHGGFLDIGDSEIPVPLTAMEINGGGEFMLPIQAETFENWPDLGDNWGTTFDAGWADPVNSFWSQAGFDTTALNNVDPNNVARVSELMDYEIGQTVDAPIGNIEELIVDLQSGQIKYAVLSFDDTSVYGEELRTIPFMAFDPNAMGENNLVFDQDFDPNLLTEAPAIDETILDDSPWFENDWDDQSEAYWSDNGYNFDLF